MKIANADKLIHHFENVVDVKLFTVPEIVTIIESFSIEFDEEARIILPRRTNQIKVSDMIRKLFRFKPGVPQKDTWPVWNGSFDEPLSEEQTDVPRLPLQVEPEFGGKCKPFIGGTNFGGQRR